MLPPHPTIGARCKTPRRSAATHRPRAIRMPEPPALTLSARASHARRGEEPRADKGAGQVQQPPQEVRPPLVADAEAAAAKQPGKRALHHPAVPPQPLAGLDPPAGQARGDAAGTEGTPQVRRVIRLVAVELGRALAGAARFPAGTD